MQKYVSVLRAVQDGTCIPVNVNSIPCVSL